MRSLVVGLCIIMSMTWLPARVCAEDDRDFLRERLDEVRERYLVSLADVQGIQTIVSHNVPPDVVVQMRILFPDMCIEVGEVQQVLEGRTIKIRVKTIRLRDAVCVQALRSSRYSYPLDLKNLTPGMYHVDVHGHTDTFVLP